MNKKIWSIGRTATFIIVGLMNTAFIRPEDIGSWKNYAGYLFLILAAVDIFFLINNYRKQLKQTK